MPAMQHSRVAHGAVVAASAASIAACASKLPLHGFSPTQAVTRSSLGGPLSQHEPQQLRRTSSTTQHLREQRCTATIALACCGVGLSGCSRRRRALAATALRPCALGQSRGRRGAARAAASTAGTAAVKPERTTLYTKAGPDGKSLGDCPFSHSVQMALRLKNVDYDVVPCVQETKPQWLIDEVGGKMPCLCHGGVPHVETSEILSWIDAEFPEPSLALPAKVSDNVRACFGIFPAIAQYTKNTDSSQDEDLKLTLQFKLASLRAYLGQMTDGFLFGSEPTLLDCELLTKLYILEHATAHYKRFNLLAFPRGDEVREYYERGSALAAFTAGAYPAEVCIWGWGQARGGS